MKSHWFGAAVVGAVAHLTAVGAFAADLPPAPVYTKAPPVAAPYSWTGFYVGGNVGGGVGDIGRNVEHRAWLQPGKCSVPKRVGFPNVKTEWVHGWTAGRL